MNRLVSALLALSALAFSFVSSADVRVNEIMSSNKKTIANAAGVYADWVELYNSGSEAVDVSGWRLCDSTTKAWSKWHALPEGTVIPANGYLLVWADDIDGILAMAEEQGVSGLVANAIIGSNLPIGDVKTVDVCTVTRLHELKCRDMNKMVARFAGFLNRRELKYVVMKGQTMATLYPHPLMRSCGDIDFYCPKESFKEAKEAIEERLNLEMTRNLS